MRKPRWVVAASAASASCLSCVVPLTLHPTMHPSQDATTSTTGVSAGATYFVQTESDSSDETKLLNIPYGEGWARFGFDEGQLELRMTPTLGYLGYRAVLTSPEDGNIGLSLQPSCGAGLWHQRASTVDFDGRTSVRHDTLLALAPNVAALVVFSEGRGFVIPRLGYLYTRSFDEDDGEGAVALGGNVGYTFVSDPFDYSIEVSFQRVASTDDDAQGPIYALVPSLGIQH